MNAGPVIAWEQETTVNGRGGDARRWNIEPGVLRWPPKLEADTASFESPPRLLTTDAPTANAHL